ncbi:MAG: response regulator transcription factor [Magnetococcus sp. DMHC-8]
MPTMTPLICLLEDDASMRFLMSSYLEKSGFRVMAYGTSAAFFAAFDKKRPDCVLLDLNLPDEDGLVVLRKIRYHSDIPLFIVSSRGGEQDRLAGIELGADDYVIKPFHPRELIARIHNILHRNARFALRGHQTPAVAVTVRRFAGFVLDLDRRRLETEQGVRVVLTRGEFNCLATLVRAQGVVVTREQLKDAVSRRQEPPQDRTVDALVCRIRRKLAAAGGTGQSILTVPGYGYQLECQLLQPA